MTKKPKRNPNQTCKICETPFYGAPSVKRVTCSMECRTEHYRQIGNLLTEGFSGEKNSNWKGGRCLHQGKYWLLLRPDHPHADHHGYVREHRLVMEQHLDRYLKPGEVVHHLNGDGLDNRIENLELYGSQRQHWLTNHLDEIQVENQRTGRNIRYGPRKP